VSKDPRETEERKALLVLRDLLVELVLKDQLEVMVLLDLQERQVLQLR